MRRLLILGSAVAFLDVAFYTAITPLLPEYKADLGLSKGEAGILSASYAAGTLVFSLPAGLLAARTGPRRTLIAGLLLLGSASFGFGFAHEAALLDATRFVQGAGGALAWSGALTWLVTTAPPDQRGAVVGTTLGAAVAGALLGPALGALAAEAGTKLIFGSVLAIALVLVAAATRFDEHREDDRQSLGEVLATLRRRPVVIASACVAAPSILFGVIAVLVPLRIDELGGGSALVAAGFTAGAALETILAPAVGRYSDRRGRLRPFGAGLLICAAAVLLVPVAGSLALLIAAVIVISLGAGLSFAPAMTMLTDAAERTGLHQGFAAGLTNMAWAAGQVTGSAGGGGLAEASSDAVPCLLASALLIAMVVVARRNFAAQAAAAGSTA